MYKRQGYDNVNIGCTVENQELADHRLPLFLSYPIKRRFIACAPLLEAIDLTPYLHGVQHVTAGETGRDARVCDYDWVLNIREQCAKANVTFWFKNTGSLFRRDGVVEKINPFEQTSACLLYTSIFCIKIEYNAADQFENNRNPHKHLHSRYKCECKSRYRADT